MGLLLRRLDQRFDLLDPETQALSHSKALRRLVDAWTDDSLRGPGNHLEHFERGDCHCGDVIFHKLLEHGARGLFLNEDQVGLKRFYLLPDDFEQGLLLADLRLHVDRLVVLLHVAQVVVDDEDFGHVDVGAHAPTRHILLEDDSVDILAFLLVSMLHCDNLDERVEVDRVGQHARRWSDRHHGVLGAVGEDLAPLMPVDAEVLNHLVDHVVKMAAKFMVEPLVCPPVSHTVVTLVAV